MSAVQHQLECTECSRSVRCDSLADAREAWRRHHDETEHYMTWTAPTEPPEGAVGGELWVARCPEDDLRSVFDSEEVARQRVRKHSEETHHTDSTVDGVRWYTSRRKWMVSRVLFPGGPEFFVLLAVLCVVLTLAVYEWATPLLGTLAAITYLILLCSVSYLLRREFKDERCSSLYRP
jgi:hypothetical protein